MLVEFQQELYIYIYSYTGPNLSYIPLITKFTIWLFNIAMENHNF